MAYTKRFYLVYDEVTNKTLIYKNDILWGEATFDGETNRSNIYKY